MARTRMAGGLKTLRAEVPFEVESSPKLSAAWDIAEGVLDWLVAQGTPSGDSLQQQAAALYRQAHGSDDESDSIERELGRTVAEVLVYVMAHRGLGKSDWSALVPRRLPDQGGTSSGPAELPIEEALMNLLLGKADRDGDGETTTVGSLPGLAAEKAFDLVSEKMGQGVIEFMTQGGN